MNLFWKEWREAIRTLPIAILVLAVVCVGEMPNRSNYVPSLANEFSFSMAIWGSVYALVLGLSQTWSEQRTDVRGWLLSHPVARWQFYWSKTVAAFLVYVIAMGVPWTVSYVWLGSVAPLTRPADPRMLIPGFWCYLAAFSFHPATVWMMARPARWVGSKTVVLAPAILVTFLAYAAFMTPWVTWAMWLVFAVVAFFVFAFPFVAQHAYVRQSNQPPVAITGTGASRFAVIAVATSVFLVGGFVTVMVVAFLGDLVRPVGDGMLEQTRWMPDGRMVNTREKYLWNETKGSSEYQVQSARFALSNKALQTDGDRGADELSPDEIDQLVVGKYVVMLHPVKWHPPFRSFDTSYHERKMGMQWIQHDDGHYLAYVEPSSVTEREPLLAMTLDKSGFGSTEQPFESRDSMQSFDSAISNFAGRRPKEVIGLVDLDGIYEASVKEQTLNVVTKLAIDEIALAPTLAGHGATALVLHDGVMTRYDIQSTEPGVPMPKLDDQVDRKATDYSPMPRFELVDPRRVELPDDWFDAPVEALPSNYTQHRYLDRGEDGFQLLRIVYGSHAKSLHVDRDFKVVSQDVYMTPVVNELTTSDAVVAALAPPILMVGYGVGSQIPVGPGAVVVLKRPVTFNVSIALGAILHGVLAWWLTRLACARRALSPGHSRALKLFSLLAGVMTPLVVLSVHPRIARTPCHGCDQSIRVDAERCPHCNVDWKSPAKTGIEVMANA